MQPRLDRRPRFARPHSGRPCLPRPRWRRDDGDADTPRVTDRPDNRLRIAIVNTSEYGGGAESCARCLRDGLTAAGHEATLWVGRPPITDPHTRLIPGEPNADPMAVRFAKKGFFSLGLASSHRFARSDALDGSDVIHLHNVHGHYFSLNAVGELATRAPLVWTFHDFFPITGGCAFPHSCDGWRNRCGSCPQLGRYPIATEFDRTRRMHSIKQALFEDLPVHIVTPSRHLARAVHDSEMFPRAEVHVIPYGTDTSTFTPSCEASRAALAISREDTVVAIVVQGLDDPRKGVDHAIEAMKAVTDKRLTILLAGAGNADRIVQALPHHDVRTLGYLASRAKLAQCLGAADLFVFTSLAENFPCVVQEAMACGTPVLGFGIPGVTEQIDPDRTGFLAPTGDTAKLGRALRQLLLNRARLHEVGAVAHKHAMTEWSLDRFIQRHEALYDAIVVAPANKRAYATGPTN